LNKDLNCRYFLFEGDEFAEFILFCDFSVSTRVEEATVEAAFSKDFEDSFLTKRGVPKEGEEAALRV
jgi:hypothetical protein